MSKSYYHCWFNKPVHKFRLLQNYLPLRKWIFTAIAEVPFDLVSANLCRKLVNFSTESCFNPCSLDLVEGKYETLLFPDSKPEENIDTQCCCLHQSQLPYLKSTVLPLVWHITLIYQYI